MSVLGRAVLNPYLELYKPEPPREKRLVVAGVDLGQSCDRSAAVALERRWGEAGFVGPVSPKIRMVQIRRWDQNTDYADVIDALLSWPVNVICVEYNGVGRPVVDVLRRMAAARGFRGRIVPVVTGDSRVQATMRMTEISGKKRYHQVVPKQDLAASVAIMIQQEMLVWPRFKPGHPLRDLMEHLKDELAKFQTRYSDRGNVQMGNLPGQGNHDDVIVALGEACHYLLGHQRGDMGITC